MATKDQSPSSRARPKSFDEALQKLDASLVSGVDDLSDMVGEEYASVRANLKDMKERVIGISSQFDSQVRQNPWPILGGVGSSAFILGILLGTKRSRRGR